MARLTLRLLGPPEVRHGEAPVTFATRKTLALLAFLATEGGSQPRERLTALLWPESDHTRGPASLRRTLAYVRDALADRGEQPHVVARGGLLRVENIDDLDLDIVRASLSGAPDVARLTAAAALARGPFLDGLTLPDSEDFDAWAVIEREAWHARMLQVFRRLSALHAESGDTVSGMDVANRWIALEPLDESAHRQLMQIHLVRGDRSAALRAYQSCRRVLAEELATEPDAATQALYEQARATSAPVAWPSPAPPEPQMEVPMVGRSVQHRRLVELIRAAAAGGVRVALVQGESGIGKTRLVREYCAWAGASGTEVLVGGADGVASGVPYQVIGDALRTKLSTLPAPCGVFPDIWLAELARLMPDLVERCPDLPRPVDNAGARLRLFEAATRVVQVMADDRPVLLVLEDMHWADSATRDLLAYAIRRWAERHTAVLVLMTARSDDIEMQTTLLAWMAALERLAPVERMELEPLSATETQALIALWPGAEHFVHLTDRLYVDSGGRALMLTERLRYLVDGGAMEDVAPGVQQILRSRFSRLSRAALDLANAAAIVARAASFDVLSRVAELDERTALDGLEELLGRRVLQATPAGYGLSHADLQRVLYADLQHERRARLHRQAVRALQSMSIPAELFRHAAAAGDPVAARGYAIEAGRAALRSLAAREAITYFTSAFGIDDTPDPAHLELARAFELVEDARSAVGTYRRLYERSSADGNVALASRALAGWAVLEAQAMRLDRAIELAANATATASLACDQQTQAEAALARALIHTYATDMDVAHEQALHAVELSRATDSVELVARSLNVLAFTRQLRGDWDLIEQPAAESVALFQRIGDRAMEVDSRCYMAAARTALGDHASSTAFARAALVMSRAIENDWGVAHSAHHLAWGLLDAGEYGQLLELEKTALESARSIRFAPLLCLNLVVVGHGRRAILDLPAAVDLHREALELGRQLGGLSRELAAGELCADFVALGEWQLAAEAAVEAREARTSARMYTDLTRPAQIAALLHAGESDTPPEPLPGDRYRIPILCAQSLAAAAQSDVAAAIEYRAIAAAEAARLMLPGEEWTIRRDLAGLYDRTGAASAARAERKRSVAILTRITQGLPASVADGLIRARAEMS